MADALDSLSDDDLDALLAGNVDTISSEGLDVLLQLDENTFSALTGQQAPEPARAFDVPGLLPSEFMSSLAELDQGSGQGDMLRGLAFESGRTERGIAQLGGTPEEKKALAQAEAKARQEFAAVDEGIGLEDAGELAFILGSLAIPGGAPVQVAAKGSKIAAFFKQLPVNWGGAAILAGLTEGLKGRTEDESVGGEALKTAGISAAGGVVGSKVGGLLINPWKFTGAGKGLAATLGATVGARDSKRIFREGIFRRMARAVTGKQRDPLTDPVPRALLRQGGQEEQRLIRAGAQAEAEVASKQGVDVEDINGFLDTFPAIIKSIRPTKASKEAGLETTAAVRGEAQTMFALLQQNAIKTNSDGTAFIDVGTLRTNLASIMESPKFETVFSKPKQKQLTELVENYSRAALASGKDQGRVSEIFEKAAAHAQGERVKGLEAVEEYLASMMGRTPDPKFGHVTATAAWMAQNELDPGAMTEHLTSDGWLGQLELFETIAEQAE